MTNQSRNPIHPLIRKVGLIRKVLRMVLLEGYPERIAREGTTGRISKIAEIGTTGRISKIAGSGATERTFKITEVDKIRVMDGIRGTDGKNGTTIGLRRKAGSGKIDVDDTHKTCL